MADIKLKYDTAVNITIILASIADNGQSASNEISNVVKLYEDYLVRFSIMTNSSGVSPSGKIFFYAIGAIDDSGRTYPNNLKGGKQLGLPMVANVDNTVFTSNVFSIKSAFDGILPQYFKVVIDNQTGTILNSTEGNHDKRAQGLWRQIV